MRFSHSNKQRLVCLFLDWKRIFMFFLIIFVFLESTSAEFDPSLATTVPMFAFRSMDVQNNTAVSAILIEPTVQPSTGSNTNSNNENATTGCNVCEGNQINPNNSLLDGTTCSDWLTNNTDTPINNTDLCLLTRLEGAAFCECPVPYQGNITCNICNGAEAMSADDNGDAVPPKNYDLPIPDYPKLTCAALLQLPAVDHSQTCDLLYQKYAKYCGCPNPPKQNPCDFCESGAVPADKPFPFPFALTGEASLDLSCRGIGNYLSVQTGTACAEARKEMLSAGGGIDLESYCECSGPEAPKPCGAFCPGGGGIPNITLDFVPSEQGQVEGGGLTCQELEIAVNYWAADNSSTCTMLKYFDGSCCVPGGGAVNATMPPLGAGTVWGVLSNASIFVGSVKLFRNGLKMFNIDEVLMDPDMQFTVFAPSDEAIAGNALVQFYQTNIVTWSGHLTTLLEHHIVVGSVFLSSNLTADLAVQSLAGDNIDFGNVLAGGGARDLVAVNGVVQEIMQILAPVWLQESIINVISGNVTGTMENTATGVPSDMPMDQNTEIPGGDATTVPGMGASTIGPSIPGDPLMNTSLGESTNMPSSSATNVATGNLSRRRRLQDMAGNEFNTLIALLSSAGLASGSILTNLTDSGATLVAPRDVAFENVSSGEGSSLIPYHVGDSNVYVDRLDNGGFVVVDTLHTSGTQLLVSKDDNGNVRYNNALVRGQMLAQNGYVPVNLFDLLAE